MMKKVIIALLAFLLISTPAVFVSADTEYLHIPATLTSGFYKNGNDSFDTFLTDEGTRCLATLCAYLDWTDYDRSADALLAYTYIGKDKDGKILWFGLGGRETSMVLMYAPDTDPNYYTGIKVDFSGSWVSTFIDVYCNPLYHNSESVMESTIQAIQNFGSSSLAK